MSESSVAPSAAFEAALDAANVDSNSAPTLDSAPPTSGPVDTTPAAPSGGHPAWNEILSAVPQSLHDAVRPTLEKWDQGVSQKLEQVHSQYNPYKQFVENNVPPDQIQAGLQLFQVLNTDPQRLYNELANFLGINTGGQGQAPQNQQQPGTQDLGEFADPQIDLEKDPRFQALAQSQQQVVQMLQQQQVQETERAANVWLDSTLMTAQQTFKAKYNQDLDTNYVLGVAMSKINAGENPDKALGTAVAMYEQAYNRIRATPTANSSAPPVLTPSGATPANNFDPAKLSEGNRKKLMGEMLTQAFKE